MLPEVDSLTNSMIMVSDGIGLVQPSAVPSSVVAAYTNDAYLRDAYRCLQVPIDESQGPTEA